MRQAVESLQRIKNAFQVLTLVIIVGIIGFMYFEKYCLLEAAWMTITTISTVGYGNFIPKTIEGKWFTLFLIITGVGVAAYTLGEFVGMVVEGHLQDFVGRQYMYRKIFRLTNHVIVCGAGRIGENVVYMLKKENVPFVVIDNNPKVTQKLSQDGVLVVEGDSSEEDILEQAGIKRSRGLITALSSDADNVFVTLTAKGMNNDLLVVARANSKESEAKLKRAGADRVISPSVIGGIKMASVVLKPFISDFVDIVLHETDIPLELEEIIIVSSSNLIGKKIKESGIKKETGSLVVAIRRKEKLLLNPEADEVIMEDDFLIAIGSSQQLSKLEKLATGRE